MSTTLVISMGFNGYQWKWRRAVRSHEVYCRQHGYSYVFVEKPAFTCLNMECAWLKLSLIKAALSAGREWVLFVDCDAVISDACPSIESVAEPSKSLFMTKGFSGRVNSGVIIAQRDPAVISLLAEILASAMSPVPPEDDVGWGENGHVIHFSKRFSGLKILGTEWNNNQDPHLRDYIRHFSAGPMRPHYNFSLSERIIGKLSKLISRYLLKSPNGQSGDFHTRLDALCERVLRDYPALIEASPATA